ncbi:uncharacterized protein TNCV_5102781 [Trichonephila clavipes]|nr:uncharacterized protein TNCV_5102781 [Trichonephila clavipes]
MGHEDELTTEELQEILNEEHQETQRNMSPSEQEEDVKGPMPTCAIKDLLKKWEDVRVMVLEWHPYQADVSSYLSNARAWLLDYLTLSLTVSTDAVSWLFIEYIALEQAVVIHPGMTKERACLVSSQTKPVDVYTQEVTSGGYAKAGNRLGSLQVPEDRVPGFQWLSKCLGILSISQCISNCGT